MRIRVAILLIVVASSTVLTQTLRPTFEVASVKRRSGPGPSTLTQAQGAAPGGAFNMINSTLVRFVMYAYDLRDYQVIGGGDWTRTQRFDISARAGRDAAPAEIRLMLQSLLDDRFRLVTRQEQREVPIYTLLVDRSDGRLGPNIKDSDDDCKAVVQRPANVPPGAATGTGCGQMSTIVRGVSTWMGAPVIDKSGLTGRYAYFMYYSPDLPLSSLGGMILPPTTSSVDPNLPSYATALREQLGLKLEASRGPIDVLVIDSVQQPTEN
jgi:uncharacterized protein (TIGR03435 family)